MGLNNYLIFLFGPLVFLNIGVEVIVPPLTTLFSDSAWEGLGNIAPVLGSVLQHVVGQFLVLLLAPGSLNHGWV